MFAYEGTFICMNRWRWMKRTIWMQPEHPSLWTVKEEQGRNQCITQWLPLSLWSFSILDCFSVAMIKSLTKSTLRREESVWLLYPNYSPPRREVEAEAWARTLKAGTEVELIEEYCLWASFFLMDCSPDFLIQPRTTWPGVSSTHSVSTHSELDLPTLIRPIW